MACRLTGGLNWGRSAPLRSLMEQLLATQMTRIGAKIDAYLATCEKGKLAQLDSCPKGQIPFGKIMR